MLQPVTLKQGAGEYGIGREAMKAEIRDGLALTLGAFPWAKV